MTKWVMVSPNGLPTLVLKAMGIMT